MVPLVLHLIWFYWHLLSTLSPVILVYHIQLPNEVHIVLTDKLLKYRVLDGSKIVKVLIT